MIHPRSCDPTGTRLGVWNDHHPVVPPTFLQRPAGDAADGLSGRVQVGKAAPGSQFQVPILIQQLHRYTVIGHDLGQ